jgi:hypothetical protein
MLSKSAKVSYESLAKYLPDFDVSEKLIPIIDSHLLTFELRLAEFTTTMTPIRRYLLAFAFSSEKKNRLLLVDNALLEELSKHLLATCMATRADVVVLIGKEGSRAQTQVQSLFLIPRPRKIIVADFDGKLQLLDFLKSLLRDIERVEDRARVLTDQTRVDLTSQTPNEKRIRLQEGDNKDIVIFANQLLQINGISESVALGIAQRFEAPCGLMDYIRTGGSLDDVTYMSRGQTKKINARVKTGILRILDPNANPQDPVR